MQYMKQWLLKKANIERLNIKSVYKYTKVIIFAEESVVWRDKNLYHFFSNMLCEMFLLTIIQANVFI